MGTSAERSSSNTEYFTRGDKIPGLQVGLIFPFKTWVAANDLSALSGERNGYHCGKASRPVRSPMGC